MLSTQFLWSIFFQKFLLPVFSIYQIKLRADIRYSSILFGHVCLLPNIFVLGPNYFCKSHQSLKLTVWIDSGISKLWGFTLCEVAIYALALITFDKPSFLGRCRALRSPPQPKAQWYYSLCKKGIICRAFIFHSTDGINTHFWELQYIQRDSLMIMNLAIGQLTSWKRRIVGSYFEKYVQWSLFAAFFRTGIEFLALSRVSQPGKHYALIPGETLRVSLDGKWDTEFGKLFEDMIKTWKF